MSQIVDDLRQVAIEIKTETQVGGNTAARVGGAFERVADALEGTQQIEDMDAAVAAVQQAAQENEQTIQDIVNSLAVVQTTGQSTSAVMSQKAVTDAINPSVGIGADASDLDITDGNRNLLARFYEGEFKTKNFDSADTPKIREGEDDFTLADDDGNVLMKLSGGHIKTKNFDSQEVGNDKPLRNKTFSLIGDSISTFAGHLVSSKQGYDGTAYNTYYPHTGNDLDNVTKTWWWKLCDLSGMVLMNNCAWSGSQATGTSTNTTSAIAGCSTRRVEDLSFASNTNPDIIIIYIGINDLKDRALGTWTGNDEIPAEGTIITFREAYALMTKKVLARYPASEVYCCTILDAGRTPFDTDDGTQTISSYPTKNIDTGCTVAMYNNAICEIAHALGAMVVDIHGCGINFWNLDNYTGDRVHPNSAGATLIANKVYKDIKSQSKY